MNIAVLDAITLGDDINLNELDSFGNKKVYKTTRSDQIIERMQNVQIAITNKVAFNEKTLKSLPDLKLICVAATGTDIIDLKTCDQLGIEVKNVKGYSTSSVTQHVFTMLFQLIGSPDYYDRFCKGPKWEESGVFTCLEQPFWEINGKRWGIIGLGSIGHSVANVANAFGCEVVYHSVSGNLQNTPYQMLPLKEILETSDIISIHCPLTENTFHLLKEEELSLIKDNAVLINVARGPVIDPLSLVNVKKHHKFRVALDVFDTEPLPSTHVLNNLRTNKEVLFSPHIGWASIEARKRLFQGVKLNIESFLNKL